MLVYGEIHFDSDQAIVGLMAKHLSELQTFPLVLLRPELHAGRRGLDRRALLSGRRADGGDAQAAAGAGQLRRGRVAGAIDLADGAVALAGADRGAAVRRRGSGPRIGSSSRRSAAVWNRFCTSWHSGRCADRPLAFGLVLCVGFSIEIHDLRRPGVGVGTAFERGRPTLAIGRWLSRAAVGCAAVWLLVYGGETVARPRSARRSTDCGGADAAAGVAAVDSDGESVGRPAERCVRPFANAFPTCLGSRAIQPLRPNYITASATVGSAIIGVSMAAVGVIAVWFVVAAVSIARRHRTARAVRRTAVQLVVGVQALLAYCDREPGGPALPALLRYAFLAMLHDRAGDRIASKWSTGAVRVRRGASARAVRRAEHARQLAHHRRISSRAAQSAQAVGRRPRRSPHSLRLGAVLGRLHHQLLLTRARDPELDREGPDPSLRNGRREKRRDRVASCGNPVWKGDGWRGGESWIR